MSKVCRLQLPNPCEKCGHMLLLVEADLQFLSSLMSDISDDLGDYLTPHLGWHRRVEEEIRGDSKSSDQLVSHGDRFGQLGPIEAEKFVGPEKCPLS